MYDGGTTFVGGAGDDSLIGSGGGNTYAFNLGDGIDHIYDSSKEDGYDDGNTIAFGSGIAPEDITLDLGSLLLHVGDSDAIHIEGFDRNNPLASPAIDHFSFADGTVLSLEELLAKGFDLNGTDDSDTLDGTAVSDRIHGFGGDDFICGGTGDDVLDGGTGDDTYVYSVGDGADRVADASGFDRVVFDSEITLDQLALSCREGEVVVMFSATDSLRFSETSPGHYAVEQLVFSDGTLWGGDEILRELSRTAPVVGAPLHTQSATEDGSFQFVVPEGTFSDADSSAGDRLAYAATCADGSPLPSWLAFDSATASFSGIPGDSDVGSLALRVIATDLAGNGVSSDFTVDVVNINDVPIGGVSLTGLAIEHQILVASNTLADADGLGGIAYRWQASSDGTNWTDIDGATADVFTLTNRQVGHQVRVTASYVDGHGTQESVESAATEAIANVNDVPVLTNALADKSATAGVSFSYVVPDNAFSDPDVGDILYLSATLANGFALPSWLNFNATTHILSGTPGGLDQGAYSIRITATDGGGLSASDVVDLTVSVNTLTGSAAADALTGTASVDKLIGLAGNDTLNGGAGADVLIGGVGNDSYVIDDVGDVVIENVGEGTDLVTTGVSYTLGANVENLTLSGSSSINGAGNALANYLSGNSGANILIGLEGNDTLNGGPGADVMIGGPGHDSYMVDNPGDIVTENANEGIDTVNTPLSYVLGANVENLFLTGQFAVGGTGNALANSLTGNAAANVLDGGAGADALVGGFGNDIYVVDNTGDVVTEGLNAGIDAVRASVSYKLIANIENLILTGAFAINGTGNEIANTLTGNAAANVLDGGVGSDTLIGGLGNDAYFVDVSTDLVVENSGEGVDIVYASVSYTLGLNVENLTLLGASAFSATGNGSANVLFGNGADNVLEGGAGDDVLFGGAGSDTLIGGVGSDTYMYSRGFGADRVQENDATPGNTDLVSFGAAGATLPTAATSITADRLWFRHVGNNDLEIDIIGTTDSLTIQDWYLGSSWHVEQFKTTDNKLLTDVRVENLVQAMAACSPHSAGQTTLPTAYQAVLTPIIAANWQ